MVNYSITLDDSFVPHEKQLRFFEAGNYHTQRFACWGNRTGKTFGVGREIFYHATGIYPDWWKGYRFSRPVRILCCTENVDMCNKNLVATLFRGQGVKDKPAIPEEFILREVFNPCTIKDRYIFHVSGGESLITFKSYKGGAKSMQGFQADVVWLDERPPIRVYEELLMRLVPFDGERTHMIVTTWPEGGYSDIVEYFVSHTEEDYIIGVDPLKDVKKNPKIQKVNELLYYSHASWSDNPHITEKVKKELELSISPHELESRRSGFPKYGSGKVFYMPESKYLHKYLEDKSHYAYIIGVDPAVLDQGAWGVSLLAYDLDNDKVYVKSSSLLSNATKSQHALNISKILPFPHCPVVIDPAGGGEDQRTQQNMADFLRNECGLNVFKANKGQYSVEDGIMQMMQAIEDDKLKIVYNEADHTGCSNLIEQIRKYSRDDNGLIIKKDDHIIDAMRYAFVHKNRALKKYSQFNNNRSYQAEDSWY